MLLQRPTPVASRQWPTLAGRYRHGNSLPHGLSYNLHKNRLRVAVGCLDAQGSRPPNGHAAEGPADHVANGQPQRMPVEGTEEEHHVPKDPPERATSTARHSTGSDGKLLLELQQQVQGVSRQLDTVHGEVLQLRTEVKGLGTTPGSQQGLWEQLRASEAREAALYGQIGRVQLAADARASQLEKELERLRKEAASSANRLRKLEHEAASKDARISTLQAELAAERQRRSSSVPTAEAIAEAVVKRMQNAQEEEQRQKQEKAAAAAAAVKAELDAAKARKDAANKEGADGTLPLYNAIKGKNLEQVKQLLQAGAAIGAELRPGGWVAIHEAAAYGTEDICQALLGAGANVQTLTEDGETPLHLATRFGSRAVVECLLQAGAAVHRKDTWGDRPLHNAVRRGSSSIVELLLEYGAPVYAKNKDRETAVDLAEQSGNHRILSALQPTSGDDDDDDGYGGISSDDDDWHYYDD